MLETNKKTKHPWDDNISVSRNACLGYSALAMHSAGLPEEVISPVLNRLAESFSMVSPDDAESFLDSIIIPPEVNLSLQ